MADPASRTVAGLCHFLGTDQETPSEAAAPRLDAALVRSAEQAGIAPLLHTRLDGLLRATDEAATALRRSAMRCEALELLRAPALGRILTACADAGIDVLLMKGAVLAYSLYRSPGQRPRTDTDLLIREADVAAMREVLAELGYQVPDVETRSTLHYQFIASRRLDTGQKDAMDIHWQISNRLALARHFDFDELRARAVTIPALGPAACGLGRLDSLLLACVHRIAHLNEGEPERMIWLYDIHLLVGALESRDISGFIGLMQDKQLTAACSAGIGKAAACFGTRVPAELAVALQQTESDPSAAGRLVDAGPLRTLWLQYCALPDWTHRLRFVHELALPAAEQIRRKYPDSRAPVAWLYLRRGFEGVRRRW